MKNLVQEGRQIQESFKNSVTESHKTKFYAWYGGKRIEIEAEDLLDAKKQAIDMFKIPKSKLGLLAVMSVKSYEQQEFRYD